jgi:hypothetical protein
MDPRRPLDETKLAELADQVWQHGLCNPYWFVLCRKAKLDRDRSGVHRRVCVFTDERKGTRGLMTSTRWQKHRRNKEQTSARVFLPHSY